MLIESAKIPSSLQEIHGQPSSKEILRQLVIFLEKWEIGKTVLIRLEKDQNY